MVKKSVVVIIFLLLAFSSHALEADLVIDISGKDLVKEHFILTLSSLDDFREFQFISTAEPLSVSSPWDYSLSQKGGDYIIESEVRDGTVEYTVLYDSMIEKTSQGKVFRTSFSGLDADTLRVEMSLPEGAFLGSGVNAVPAPGSITSDGRRIVLSWEFSGEEPRELAVFYTAPAKRGPVLFILSLAIILCCAIMAFFFFHSRKKVRDIITGTLGEEEKKVVGLLREGFSKQKEISEQLGFSKSKMSKVLRKLEEKGLIEKTPFFKTNKIILKKM